MAAVITDVQPRRFREGDQITVTGSGFSPNFGDNRVNVNLGTAAFIISESDTEIVCEVPSGIPTDQQVEVIVSRIDTQQASDPFACWGLASADAIRDLDLPGQIPGPREASNLDADLPDVGQARDYERLTAHALRIANEILEQQGDIFTSDGTNPTRQEARGGDMELHARSDEPTGLHWEESRRWIPLRYGGEISGGPAQPLKANGQPFSSPATGQEHGVPFDGRLTSVAVYRHADGSAPDVLDRVRVLVNGGSVYDSGAGLALPSSSAYTDTMNVQVQFNDQVELECTAAAGGNPVNLTGSIRLEELTSVKSADRIAITDEVTAEKIGEQDRAAQDEVDVDDLVAAEVLR